MGHRSLAECLGDLDRNGHLVRVPDLVDPRLEMSEIHRRVFRAGGPAVLFERVKGTPFRAVCNLFGTRARTRFIFRGALEAVHALVRARVDPAAVLRDPRSLLALPRAALDLAPRPSSRVPVLAHETSLSRLPQIVSWPDDGGPFVTLPQVYSEDPDRPGVRRSNLGMYRVQLAGNAYLPDREVGLHYQIHRGLGVHPAAAMRRGEALRVNVFVGGPPAMTLAAVMPLPEGLPEVAFAGALNRRAIRMVRRGPGPLVHADADFCIQGRIAAATKPEGPFGDHLGYYSGRHDFPVLEVESVHHREGAIWPFTTVGRPPQEDTILGELIHELTAPLVPEVIAGVSAVHAVDATGVHPLLLAVGSERYVPYEPTRRPMEVLTQSNAILGTGQLSLAKYLFIAAREDAPALDVRDVRGFLEHVLARVDLARDLHFHVNTTMDTLDYSGTGLNLGSKLVVAGVGEPRRRLGTHLGGLRLPDGYGDPAIAMPGVVVVRAPPFTGATGDAASLAGFSQAALVPPELPLVVLVDDSAATSRTLDDFLWVTFTRSNPAVDVSGTRAFTEHKAWGCRGSLVIDARAKPHHAPPLVEDPAVSRRVDALGLKGRALHGWV